MKVAQITRACYLLVKGDGRRGRNFTAGRKSGPKDRKTARNEEHKGRGRH